ncbi:phosphate starvation-inducible protein PhoH [Paenibacillus protaetiae]|uniref:Phosphate starvation-inducible protein PhoH n=1 Tax=Paenibacillus protaetiae TaxID=2509456 RepID=A0A4P6EVX0_9BACL|nr:phosphate starvation-inducible protein PhoH [Paenibacillus protaetiae]QAY67450.1 phosphate starvation-inducible protein PhoH [Paenibacillus protaetiae]
MSSRIREAQIALMDTGCYFSSYRAGRTSVPAGGVTVDLYDLPRLDPQQYACMVIDHLADQEFLYRERSAVQAFLEEGNIVVFSGHLFRPWLPGASLFQPKAFQAVDDYRISIDHPHPIFEGVEPDDMTFNKGVAGFFARGHHEPPLQAEVLLRLPGGEAVTYIDRHSTRGTIVVHSGNNLMGYDHQGSTSGRIGGQLRGWVQAEHAELQARRALR